MSESEHVLSQRAEQSPKLSVIMPTRNHASRITEPLRAILRQTLPAWQYDLLVVDNGSTDGTPQVLDRLAAGASNLHWVHEPVVGKSEARNRGIRESAGEIVLFMDDDILVEPDHLERHLAYHADASKTIAVLGTVNEISPLKPSWLEDYFRSRQWMITPQANAELGSLSFATGNVSLPRWVLEESQIGDTDPPEYFDPAFQIRQDGELGYRLGKVGVQLVLAEDIVCYHDHPRDLKAILRRSYGAGYATAQLIQKHPELAKEGTGLLPASPLISYGLLLACTVLFIPTFLLRPVWREPSRKVIGAYLHYHETRGYQKGCRDLNSGGKAGPASRRVSPSRNQRSAL